LRGIQQREQKTLGNSEIFMKKTDGCDFGPKFETTSFPISGDPRRNPMFFVPGWGSMKKIGPTSTGLKLLEFLKKTQRLGSFQIKKMFSHMAVSKNRGTHKMDGL